MYYILLKFDMECRKKHIYRIKHRKKKKAKENKTSLNGKSEKTDSQFKQLLQ